MKTKGKILYSCCVCQAHTTVLHEIVFGSLYKRVCEDFNIQVPLCQRCHQSAHGQKDGKVYTEYDCMSQNDCLRYFCDLLSIDVVKVVPAVKNKTDRPYLDTINNTCLNKIRQYEV